MSVTAIPARADVPVQTNINITVASATGTVSEGDWVCYSGQFARSQFSGGAPGTAYWKTSGAGIALESNPVYDPAGRSILNSAMKILVEGHVWVSAAFSGQPANGIGAYPVTTGSGVGAATGLTGVAATWQTAQVINGSAYSGTANAQHPAVATVIASRNFSNGGTGELLIRLAALAPDVRG